MFTTALITEFKLIIMQLKSSPSLTSPVPKTQQQPVAATWNSAATTWTDCTTHSTTILFYQYRLHLREFCPFISWDGHFPVSFNKTAIIFSSHLNYLSLSVFRSRMQMPESWRQDCLWHSCLCSTQAAGHYCQYPTAEISLVYMLLNYLVYVLYGYDQKKKKTGHVVSGSVLPYCSTNYKIIQIIRSVFLTQRNHPVIV